MIEYVIIFLVMLVCVIVGVWIGMQCEKKAQDKAERERYRPLRNSPVEVDLDDDKSPEPDVVSVTPKDVVPAAEPDVPTQIQQPHVTPNNNASPLSRKIDPEFADELDQAKMEALEEKMRHQDASFNTLNALTEEAL